MRMSTPGRKMEAVVRRRFDRLEERRGVQPLLMGSTVCKSRGIYGNYLRLPRLIPPCGGTQAATPHIPAANPAPGRCGRLPVQSQYPAPQYPVRTLKKERHKEPRQLWRVQYTRIKILPMSELRMIPCRG